MKPGLPPGHPPLLLPLDHTCKRRVNSSDGSGMSRRRRVGMIRKSWGGMSRWSKSGMSRRSRDGMSRRSTIAGGTTSAPVIAVS